MTENKKHQQISSLVKRNLIAASCAVLIILCAVLVTAELVMEAREERVVAARMLNVYESDSFSSENKGTLFRGEQVRILEKSNDMSHITNAYGLDGWCATRYLRRQGLITNAYLALRFPQGNVVRYSSEDCYKELLALKEDYPELVSVSQEGASTWGTPIYMLRVGDADAQNCIMVQGAIHAREYSTAKVVTQMARWLLEDTAKDASLLTDTKVVFIPYMNPDGAALCQDGLVAAPDDMRDALISMNNGFTDFTRWKANGRGVDLNSNFAARWVQNENYPQAGSTGYRGEGPFSEPETQCIKSITEAEGVDMMLCYHSYGQIIYWYFGQTGDTLARDESISAALGEMLAYEPMPAQEPITSVAGSKDWFVEEYGKTGLTIELFDTGEMPVSADKYNTEVQKHRGVLSYAIGALKSK